MAKTRLVEIHPLGTQAILLELIEYFFEDEKESVRLEDKTYKFLKQSLELYGPKMASNLVIDYARVRNFHLL